MLTIADERGGGSKKNKFGKFEKSRFLLPSFLFLHILASAAGKDCNTVNLSLSTGKDYTHTNKL